MRMIILEKFGGDSYLKEGMSGFKVTDFKKSQKEEKPYECRGNIFWVEEWATGCAVRPQAIDDVIRLNYPEPRPVEPVLHVALKSDRIEMSSFGTLTAVSPEEDRFAVFSAVIRDLNDDEKLEAWKTAIVFI